MRVFKTRIFARFARKQGIDDPALRAAIDRAVRGLVDADHTQLERAVTEGELLEVDYRGQED
jgi:hypothetical protein